MLRVQVGGAACDPTEVGGASHAREEEAAHPHGGSEPPATHHLLQGGRGPRTRLSFSLNSEQLPLEGSA